MSAVVPSAFDFPALSDGALIAAARVIDKGDEIGKYPVERVNFLYAAGNRPAVVSLAWSVVLQNPATSVVWSPYIPIKIGPDRQDWTIKGWGEYIEIQVQLYDTSKATVAGGSTGTMTVGATAAEFSGTWTISASPLPEAGYIRYGWRENPSTPGQIAKLHWIRVLPDTLGAGDLPVG